MFADWLNNVFQHPTLAGSGIIAAKTALIYLFLVAGLRLLGKRELGQMNIYDLVLIIVLANAVQNAMVGDDNSLVGGLIAATVLLVMNRLFALALSRSAKLEKVMVGEASLILNDGVPIEDRMRRDGVTKEQLMAALREHSLERLEDAHMCILEVDGSISVVPKTADVRRTRRHFKAVRLP